MTDERLMIAYQRGNEDAFTLLYRRYDRKVTNWVRRIVRRKSEIDDAAQNTWIRVVRFRFRYDATKPFDPWIYQISCREAIRVTETREMDSLDWEPESRPDVSAELTQGLSAALSHLPEDQRQVVVGQYFDAKSVRQLSVEMGLTSKVVRGIKRKALSALASNLET
jgi:RNA polymerase sigma factor (sigma-70 family)